MDAQQTSYDKKSRKKDFAQHAKKIYTAIRELEPELATKRAIWELFQNALDLSKQNDTIIKISKQKGSLKFEHNGKPFDEDSLASLIKQTSDKAFGDNTDNIGQYGTGFLTTHIYGKNFSISGSVETEDNGIKELIDFRIDRDATDIDSLMLKIEAQDIRARNICSDDKVSLYAHKDTTSFLYETSQNSERYIDVMMEYIPNVLPYVFVFNEKLQRVELNVDDQEIIFNRLISNNENRLLLDINNESQIFNFISFSKNDIKIILPNSIDNLSNFPKLFLYYPLIGTENIGFNFIIHSKNFRPNEKRNSIFLEAKNIELESDVNLNKEILRSSFELIKQHILENVELDIFPFLNIQQTNDFFLDELKSDFISFCKELKRIKLEDESLTSLSMIYFFNEEILKYELQELRSIYSVVKQFYPLPPFEKYIYLCKLVNKWDDFGFIKVGLEEILNNIESETELQYDKILDKVSYLSLIELVSGNIDLLNKYKVIPNIHKRFMLYKDLRRWNKIESDLILIMDNLNADVSSSYLLEDFYTINNIQEYTREHYKEQINNLCTSLFNEIDKNGGSSIAKVKYYYLIKWLNYFIGLNKTTKVNVELNDFLSKYYFLDNVDNRIDSPTSILQYDSQIKLLARLFIADLKNKDENSIKECLPQLEKFVSILFESQELKRNLLDKLECYPAQSYKLYSSKELKIDEVLDFEFKKKYNEITKENIFDNLVMPEFKKYLQHQDSIIANTVGKEIEDILLGGKELYKNALVDDNNPELFTLLLNFIDYISKEGSKWGEWLPKLNREKEEILLSQFKDDQTRNSLFSILSKSSDKIQLLGKLSEIEDLEELIKKGNEKLKEEARQKQHTDYIKKIGLKIQDLIENQLDKELAKTIELLASDNVTNKEEQNGQDFIIYKNQNPVYYIEVKSKWDKNGRFLLSKNQTEKCAEQKKNYAVVSVNVDKYKKDKDKDTENIDFDDLKDYIKVNNNLGKDFEILLLENIRLDENNSPKLVDYSGLIPLKVIDNEGVVFDFFINDLKSYLISI